ncbi:MAG: hypothetical protein DKT66_14535 [Candidatus Melainabacteria bacterium]|nr:MAG: hypothetical protein DKT66_14535 [Candidatus Melainabacteria bacterium]
MFDNDIDLSNEEKECLRMWFRQAIAQVEIEETTAAIIRDRAFFEGTETHRTNAVGVKRPSRGRVTTHGRGVLV